MADTKDRKTVRDEFAQKFLLLLDSPKPLQWTQGWESSLKVPYNGETGHKYHGINRLILMFEGMEKGWTDNRFYTFHQVSRMEGCKVRAGEKATRVEYWAAYDTKEKRSVTLSEMAQILRDDPDRKQTEFSLYSKMAFVFNAAQVEGLSPLEEHTKSTENDNPLAEAFIDTLSQNLEVTISYGGNEAFYSPTRDAICLPPREAFCSPGEYYGTALHELGHSTGSPSRLNRPLRPFGEDPDEYAREELCAEIASTFVCGELGVAMPDSVIDNHLSYVQSWMEQIKENNGVLFDAIKEAEHISDYMVDMGRLDELREKIAIEQEMPRDFLGGTYEVWQLKQTPENDIIKFMSFSFANTFRLTESRYEKVYAAPVDGETDRLDKSTISSISAVPRATKAIPCL